MNVNDCLASTGAVFPVLGLVLALALVVIGVSAVLVKKKLAKTALIVVPVLLLAGLFWGYVPSAHAESACGSSSTMPVPSESASSSSSASSSPCGPAPTITTVGATVTLDNAWTISACGEGPITFGIYTFTWMQGAAAHLQVNSNTGVVTPPTGADRLSACMGNFVGNTVTGIQVGFYAHNFYGGQQHEALVYFTIDDHVWCNANNT